MTERLPAPKPIPKDEWLKAEIKRGETFPEYIVPLRARVKTPEQHEIYRELKEQADKIAQELFERWPQPWQLTKEQHDEILYRYETSFTEMASKARSLADSYRNFNVGAVIVGYKDPRILDREGTSPPRYPSDRLANPWNILFDANTRQATDKDGVAIPRDPTELGEYSGVRKYCAELALSDRIDPEKPEFGTDDEKGLHSIGLFVVGEAQTDNDSEIRQITLTCCKLCRSRLWKKTLSEDDEGNEQTPIYSKDMPVISADARNLNNRKWQPIRRLHEFHGELPPRYQEID